MTTYPIHSPSAFQPEIPYLAYLPPTLRLEIQNPPRSGYGIHQWLFQKALHLHHYLSPREISEVLRRVTLGCDRHVPDREITDAVSNSARISGRRIGVTGDTALLDPIRIHSAKSTWPNCDKKLQQVIAKRHKGFDLIDSSPGLRGRTADLYVPAMMGEGLLCCGESTSLFKTKLLSQWGGSLNEQQFVVPSPMTSPWGITREGRPSMHTIANTGRRRFIVVEFDDVDPNDQLPLHMHLAEKAPLALVVHSAGKSFHGWYYCQGFPEERVRAFFEYAVRLGADNRTWSRAQFVRMPGGLRRMPDGEFRLQTVLYFNPNAYPAPSPIR